MNAQGSDSGELTYTRIFDAPRALVFRCMIEPTHLTHFWGPIGVSTPLEEIQVDARQGGVFETVMVNDSDGTRYSMRALFVEIIEPERLVWTDPDTGVTTISAFFDLGDARTEICIRQTNGGCPDRRGIWVTTPDVSATRPPPSSNRSDRV